MDEQRIAAYSNLIQQLLECPNGEQNDILNANEELVDADFVQFMKETAADMAEKSNSYAGWLQNLAAQLANYFGNNAISEEYLSFLMEVLKATALSEVNPQVVYPILQHNLDKLNLNFAKKLQVYVTSKFTEFTLEQAKSFATDIVNFGILINHFSLGSRAGNLEISIACYDSALKVHTYEQFPQQWAMTQNNLGAAYRDRIQGEKAQNIEDAIACHQSALKVYTPEQFPQYWAGIQHNLADAYNDRIQGEKDQNLEISIACHQSALKVLTPEQFPQQWAMTQNNLGNGYCNRIQGEKAENIESALACYKSALKVRTREQFPQYWAMTQNNLGNAYGDRIQGKKAQNIEEAISCFQSALKVYTPEQFPQYWAGTLHNLGNAYRNRIQGEKAQNIEEAISCFRSALKVYIPEQFPQDWATTQNSLGAAYGYRIQGEKAQNIEEAISCFQSALIVYTPTAFPLECLTSSKNLGNIAFTAGFWEIAIEGYEQAMTAVEQSRSWITSDDRRQQIVAESIDVYENAIQACVNSGKLEKAIEYCDRTRSKHLVDLMHSNDLYANGEIPPEVAQYLREFESKQQEIDGEVEQLRNPSSGNKGLASVGSQSRSRADVVAYTDKIAELEAEKQQVWENIRRLDPVLAGQIQVDRMEFAAMQKLIDNSNTAIICFYTTRNDTHIFVIYKDKAPQIHTCQGEGLAFQDWIDDTWLSPYLADQLNKTDYWEQGMGEFLSQLSQRLKVNDLGSSLLGMPN